MSAFSKLKQNRAASQAKLVEFQKNGGKQSFEEDKRYWQPVVDPKTGIGEAVIRFLPAPGEEDFPFVTIYEHAFMRAGGWYIEKSRSSLPGNEPDPVLEYNDKLWKSGVESDKDLVRGDPTRKIKGSKRNRYFISNILVIKHDARPEDEGQVFLYKYGLKIKEKADKKLTPVFASVESVNVYDFWEGADFMLRIAKVSGQRNYDNAEFDKPSALFGGDEDKLEALFNSQYSLAAEIAEDKFKPYDVLAKQLARVLGTAGQQAEGRGNRAANPEREARPNREAQRRDVSRDVEEDDDAFFRNVQSGGYDDDEIPF